jgi:hypothetical protein
MIKRPSGTKTRSASRNTWCGSALPSNACGKTSKSKLDAAKGKAAGSQTMETGAVDVAELAGKASQRWGIRLACNAAKAGQPSCKAL